MTRVSRTCHVTVTRLSHDPIGCCCCNLPYMLACNKALCARWMAWEVISSSYTLHGYSISENQAHLAFNAFDYKKMFVTYYVKVWRVCVHDIILRYTVHVHCIMFIFVYLCICVFAFM